MDIMIREYRRADLPFMTEIWNQIVGEGNAFPQEEMLSEAEAEAFFCRTDLLWSGSGHRV